MISRSAVRYVAGEVFDRAVAFTTLVVIERYPRAAGWALKSARCAVVTSDSTSITVERSRDGEPLLKARLMADGSWALDDLSGGAKLAGLSLREVTDHIRAELLRLNLALVGSLP